MTSGDVSKSPGPDVSAHSVSDVTGVVATKLVIKSPSAAKSSAAQKLHEPPICDSNENSRKAIQMSNAQSMFEIDRVDGMMKQLAAISEEYRKELANCIEILKAVHFTGKEETRSTYLADCTEQRKPNSNPNSLYHCASEMRAPNVATRHASLVPSPTAQPTRDSREPLQMPETVLFEGGEAEADSVEARQMPEVPLSMEQRVSRL
eukprot:gnl/TRDRNA2_/TRDRNA2_77562_c0_seq1.p1 gnl/TRDRNA2_/TRDRNA2_77562_c0~~gnl/TRDRNA2_/TRDRNA2_77562_c0_seq1.p1  ORF type:complete len:215 (+),score=32.47 gnl/TRDRNA2_/TRDRNA2_77562_c0_seq1:28-645(+)